MVLVFILCCLCLYSPLKTPLEKLFIESSSLLLVTDWNCVKWVGTAGRGQDCWRGRQGASSPQSVKSHSMLLQYKVPIFK